MKLKRIGKGSATEVTVGEVTILFSYQTPVAYNDGTGFYRTDRAYSSTTSKHIKQWLNGANAQTVPQEQIDKLAGEQVRGS